MKRFLLTVGLAAVWCYFTRHTPKRHPLGGWKCEACKRSSADLEGQGYGDQQLHGMRAYSRESGGSYMRSDRWQPMDDRARRGGL